MGPRVGESVCIVIVNYRTAHLCIDCLRSLEAQLPAVPRLHAILVDNASGDGSLEKLAQTIEQEGWRD